MFQLVGSPCGPYPYHTPGYVLIVGQWIPDRKGFTMSKEQFLSVGIDVGSTFSWMAIVDPEENLILKPFKIFHNNLDSLNRALDAIKKADEAYSLNPHIHMESTGTYHFPLFCFFKESGLPTYVINPLITHSIKNYGIRKAKNDKLDSIGIAKLGLKPDLRLSIIPEKMILDLRALTRNYYKLVDTRSGYVIQLKTFLSTVFPQYIGIFSDITGTTSMMILEDYPTPDKILRAHRNCLIRKISKASRKGISKATEKYEQLVQAARNAKTFGCDLDSVYFNISLTIDMIHHLNDAIADTRKRMLQIVEEHKEETFVQQIYWLNSIPGVGFLTAVTLMCEIGDFSVFKNPRQLLAYFGIDPEVRQSGKFTATEMHMSKRGSSFARRAIFAAALACIRTKKNGEAVNPYLYDYYQKKSASKPKKVALRAVMHKLVNYVFAVLRDETDFVLRSPAEHCNSYVRPVQEAA